MAEALPPEHAWAAFLISRVERAEDALWGTQGHEPPSWAALFAEQARSCVSRALLARLALCARPTAEAYMAEQMSRECPLLALGIDFATSSQREQAAADLLAKLTESNGDELFKAAPALPSLLDRTEDQLVCAMREMASRLAADAKRIAGELFCADDLGEIQDVKLGAGDAHCGGQAVCVLTTPHGRILYKPHDCRLDAAYARLVECHFAGLLAVPKVVVGDGYGWHSFVEERPADDESQVDAFYERMGAALALAHALGSSDLHKENWMACGGMPVLVDLETVLCPRPRAFGAASHAEGLGSGGFRGDVNRSVIYLGMLPCLQGDTELSPLLGNEGTARCRPLLGGQRQTVPGHEEAFLEGFSQGYDLCLARRSELRDWLDGLAGMPVRFLVRNTSYYERLGKRLLEPAALRREQERKGRADRLVDYFERQGAPELAGIGRAEAASLLNGDIPYFCVKADGRDLCAASLDDVVVTEYFAASAIEAARERLANLSEADKCLELGLIRQAFEQAAIKEAGEPQARTQAQRSSGGLLNRTVDPGPAQAASGPAHPAHTPEAATLSVAAPSNPARPVRALGTATLPTPATSAPSLDGRANPSSTPPGPAPLNAAYRGRPLSEQALEAAAAALDSLHDHVLTGPSGQRGWAGRSAEQGPIGALRPFLAMGTTGLGVFFAAFAASGAAASERDKGADLLDIALTDLEGFLGHVDAAGLSPAATPGILGITDGLGGLLLGLAHIHASLGGACSPQAAPEGTSPLQAALTGLDGVRPSQAVLSGGHPSQASMEGVRPSQAIKDVRHPSQAVLEDGRPRLIAQRITDLAASIDLDEATQADRYSGLAGLITGLAACTQQGMVDERAASGIAARAAQRLMSLRNVTDPTYPGSGKVPVLWNTAGKRRPIGGAGHGQIGIAQALLEAAALAGGHAHCNDWIDAACDALAFEERSFSDKLQTWPDYRSSSRPSQAMHGMCSGAPGTGLAYLRCHELGARIGLSGKAMLGIEEGIRRAALACARRPPLRRDHLCCGNAAALDFLLELSARSPHIVDAATLDACQAKAKELAGAMASPGWRLMPVGYREAYSGGLFFGVAGIGYELLRFAEAAMDGDARLNLRSIFL